MSVASACLIVMSQSQVIEVNTHSCIILLSLPNLIVVTPMVLKLGLWQVVQISPEYPQADNWPEFE